MQGVLLDSELRLEITLMKIKLFADFVKVHAATEHHRAPFLKMKNKILQSRFKKKLFAQQTFNIDTHIPTCTQHYNHQNKD